MSYFDPEIAFERLKEKTTDAIKSHFPVTTNAKTMKLHKVWVEDSKSPNDYPSQLKARLAHGNWEVPIKGEVELIDNKSGKATTQTVTIGHLPRMTDRYSYIVKGNEYQIGIQTRLKPGAYVRVKANGELEGFLNFPLSSNRKKMKVHFDPETRQFIANYGGTTNINLRSILKGAGIPDATVERSWGKEISDANAPKDWAKDVARLAKVAKAPIPGNDKDAAAWLQEWLKGATFDPAVTKATLGEAFDHASGPALLAVSNKLLGVSRGEVAPDDRNSLKFASFHGLDDMLHDFLTKTKKRDIVAKLKRRMDSPTTSNPREIFATPIYRKVVAEAFLPKTFAMVRTPTQTNPLEMVSNHTSITRLGKGGIGDEKAVEEDARLLNFSHMGFIDPIHTPECFDDQTEVFTSRGWVPWPRVMDMDLLAARSNGELVFRQPDRVVREHYDGVMYGARNNRIDYLVTPNHRMYSKRMCGTLWRFEYAKDMHGQKRRFTSGHIPYEGHGITHFKLPEIENNSHTQIATPPIAIDDWAEFLAWFLSEGCCAYDESKSNYIVRLAQSKEANPDNCAQIEALLARLPWKWCLDGSESSYAIGVKQLASYLKNQGYCDTKFIPEESFSWPRSALFRLLQTLLKGDGRTESNRASGVHYKQQVYTTTSPELATGVERLGVLLGYATTRSVYQDKREERYLPIHEVRLLKNTVHGVYPKHPRSGMDDFYTTQYSGMVYCATVPGGALLVRRGKSVPYWTGNSDKAGITLHLALGSDKRGTDLVTQVYDRKEKKMVWVNPVEATAHHIVMPDQVKWKDGVPTATHGKVKMMSPKGDIIEEPIAKARYVMTSTKAPFGMASNLIPFLNNNQGNRASMATRQGEQAVALVHREEPLVQVRTARKGDTFERLFGNLFAHTTPTGGTVTKVTADAIYVKEGKGKSVLIPIYNHFPLNEDAMMINATPLVKVGDKVKAGQVVADTSFTKNGVLSMGSNLRVAYLPAKGYNYEDATVISESAAKKLTSEHLHRHQVKLENETQVSRNVLRAEKPDLHHSGAMDKLDEHGIVRDGETVNPGDVLIARIDKRYQTARGKSFKKVFQKAYRANPILWEGDGPGKVVRTYKDDGSVQVFVKTHEPTGAGDKIVARHANKSIVSKVLPDNEMPRDKDGKHFEVLLSPFGIPSRINPSQMLETAASKLASPGHPFIVDNFNSDILDSAREIRGKLRQAGLPDDGKEEVFDPTTGRSLGRVLTGHQYVVKQKHMVDKKLKTRAGGFESSYDMNHLPTRGDGGGQSMDTMGIYALLSHGAKEVVRESQTSKADRDMDYWEKLLSGEPLPPPKVPFVYEKFETLLKGLGVDLAKKGSSVRMVPSTDRQIRKYNKVELPSQMLRSKNLAPMKGGLFDPQIFGGETGMDGQRWGYFDLPMKMPNPLFEKAIKTVTGLGANFNRALDYKYEEDGLSGPALIEHKLAAINPETEIPKLEQLSKKQKGATRSQTFKKIKLLKVLAREKLSPVDAYTMSAVPVLPPIFRPASTMNLEQYVTDRQIGSTGKSLEVHDLNMLYKEIGLLAKEIHEKDPDAPDESHHELTTRLYNNLKAYEGFATPYKQDTKGIIALIAGDKPSSGYFQSKMVGKRQDMSMRSTIIPEPTMGMDEIGLPEKAAREMFKPLIVREMARSGYSPLDALKKVNSNAPEVKPYLMRALASRPVLVKRDPALHKHNVLAFNPILTKGNAIKIHPLVTGSVMGADFDGDTVSVFVPVRDKAVEESKRMYPTKNLLSPTTMGIMYKPEHDAAQGLFELSKWGTKSGKKYDSIGELVRGYNKRELELTDVATVNGKATTPGRALLYQALPTEHSDRLNILHDPKMRLTTKQVNTVLVDVAKTHPTHYNDVYNKLLYVGNEAAYDTGFSVGLDDIEAQSDIRDPHLKKLRTRIDDIHKGKKKLSDQDDDVVAAITKTMSEMEPLIQARFAPDSGHRNAFMEMKHSGAKGNWSQLKQIISAPMIVTDPHGNPVPHLIGRSYSEGLDLGDYFTALHGARKGTLTKQTSTREPGALTKQIVASNVTLLVDGADCGTKSGISLHVGNNDDAIVNRYCAKTIKSPSGKVLCESGELITPRTLTHLKNNKIKTVIARSPARCNHAEGVCAKCMGIWESGIELPQGSNVGIRAAHALGEPGVNLAMKSFHGGGVFVPLAGNAGKGAEAVEAFQRVKELLQMPSTLKGSAVLSKANGMVKNIAKDPAGGWRLQVGEESHYVPSDREVHVGKGDKVSKGQALTSGKINPHHLLPLAGVKAVQQFLADELQKTYKQQGIDIDRRHTEVIARGMTNVAEVTDAGTHPFWEPGDYVPMSKVIKFNDNMQANWQPIKAKSVLRGRNTPLDAQEDWMAKLQFERLQDTLVNAASKGQKSELHSRHPVPAMAYGREFGHAADPVEY